MFWFGIAMDSEQRKEVERLLRELSRGEKAQLLQWVAPGSGGRPPGDRE
jgi:hypothetical protein